MITRFMSFPRKHALDYDRGRESRILVLIQMGIRQNWIPDRVGNDSVKPLFIKFTAMRLTPDKKLHSKEHLLADDLSRMMAEPKKFAAYLGIAELYYESDLRALARRVLEKEDLPIDARGKYFFAALRGLVKQPGAKLKTRKKKKRIKKKPSKNAVS